ncbi:MAG: hypothetical protein IJT32_01820, partial [Lachnospiraceae bacterium]|nr:hypothetical protein [Lachnospiraceae bacterium]
YTERHAVCPKWIRRHSGIVTLPKAEWLRRSTEICTHEKNYYLCMKKISEEADIGATRQYHAQVWPSPRPAAIPD